MLSKDYLLSKSVFSKLDGDLWQSILSSILWHIYNNIYEFLYMLLIKTYRIHSSSVQALRLLIFLLKTSKKRIWVGFFSRLDSALAEGISLPLQCAAETPPQNLLFSVIDSVLSAARIASQTTIQSSKEIKHKSLKIQSDCWAKPTKLRNLILLEYLDVLGVIECRSTVLLSLRMS